MEASLSHNNILQENGDRTEFKLYAADEAIKILTNAYESSNISETARKEMHDINEMVSILTCFYSCVNLQRDNTIYCLAS